MKENTTITTYEQDIDLYEIQMLVHDVLKGFLPNLRFEQITTQEVKFEPSLTEVFAPLQVLFLTGHTTASGVQTQINFDDNCGVRFEAIQTLKNIMCELTGVHHSYSNSSICHHNSAENLIETLDRNAFLSAARMRLRKDFVVCEPR